MRTIADRGYARLAKSVIGPGTLVGILVIGAVAASGHTGSSRPHPPSAAEARMLRRAEASRHHPKGTKILAMRVAGPQDRYAAVIFRVPNADTLAAGSTARAAAGKIIHFPGAGTDYYDNGKPSRPITSLRPRYYDIHAVATGNGTGHYFVPHVNDGNGGCTSGSIEYTANSNESFTADAHHVRIPSSGSVARSATYTGNSGETDQDGACGNTPASSTSCQHTGGLNDVGTREHDNIEVRGYLLSAAPVALLDGNATETFTGSCAGPYATLAGTFLGGNATLSQDGVSNGYGFTLPFDPGGVAQQIAGTKHCSGATCGIPTECSNDASGNPEGTTCDSSYTFSGRIEAFPSGF